MNGGITASGLRPCACAAAVRRTAALRAPGSRPPPLPWGPAVGSPGRSAWSPVRTRGRPGSTDGPAHRRAIRSDRIADAPAGGRPTRDRVVAQRARNRLRTPGTARADERGSGPVPEETTSCAYPRRYPAPETVRQPPPRARSPVGLRPQQFQSAVPKGCNQPGKQVTISRRKQLQSAAGNPCDQPNPPTWPAAR